MTEQLEEVAAENDMSCARFVRGLIAGAVSGRRVNAPSELTREELLNLLSEKARQGNVAAIRTLLVREEEQNPRERLLAEFARMAEDARSRAS